MTETSTSTTATATSPPPLTLKQWAAVFAYVCHYSIEQRADVLARLEVEPREWDEASGRWADEIARGVADEDPSLGAAFNAAFLPAKRQLKKECPEIPSIEP